MRWFRWEKTHKHRLGTKASTTACSDLQMNGYESTADPAISASSLIMFDLHQFLLSLRAKSYATCTPPPPTLINLPPT